MASTPRARPVEYGIVDGAVSAHATVAPTASVVPANTQDYWGTSGAPGGAPVPVAQTAPAAAPAAVARPVEEHVVAAVESHDLAICRGCGRQFPRRMDENPASARYYRCEACNVPDFCALS